MRDVVKVVGVDVVNIFAGMQNFSVALQLLQYCLVTTFLGCDNDGLKLLTKEMTASCGS